jgi:hypothetical protein
MFATGRPSVTHRRRSSDFAAWDLSDAPRQARLRGPQRGDGDAMAQRCVSCGRPGVRRQEMQKHARLLIQRGLVAEAKQPRCLRCVQQLINDQEVLRDEKPGCVSLRR